MNGFNRKCVQDDLLAKIREAKPTAQDGNEVSDILVLAF